MKAFADSSRSHEKGVAMVTAILAALIVSLTAAVVLNLTFRRFELSAFRTDHAVAALESEAGLQFAFARLEDPAFQALVQAKRNAVTPGTAVPANNAAVEYVVSCRADLDPNTPGNQAPDQQVTGLHMGGTRAPPPPDRDGTGGKHVTVRIRFFNAADIAGGVAPIAARPYRVRAFADFGTGGA